MKKKRLSPSGPVAKRTRHPRHRGPHQRPRPLPDRIQTLLTARDEPLSVHRIQQELALPDSARKVIRETLHQMVHSGQARKKGKKFLAGPARHLDLHQGTLSLARKGFGFVRLDEQAPGAKDIFIGQRHLNGASHGDTVLIQIMKGSFRGRREGRVVRIVKRAVTSLCGIYARQSSNGILLPDDPKLPFVVFIPDRHRKKAKNGQAVLARITDYGTGDQGPSGEIIEVLGDPLTVEVQLRMAMEKQGLRQGFPAEVIEESEELAELTRCDSGRVDLRHIPHVTIDGATARDFDDAVAVEKTDSGYRLFVSIADVSHYVRPGTALDREAFQRGTSVYFPSTVLPMLPERLSNDLCSLVPDRDRPAFTAILDFDRQGAPVRSRYQRSLIRSHQRFTYETVHRILYLRQKNARTKYRKLVPMLEAARELSTRLRRRREKRGSLGFTIPEAEIVVTDGRIKSMGHARRNQAHLLIEDFMLAANEAVAETLDRAGARVLFRVHESPDPDKVETFTEAAAAMGIPLKKTEITPAWFAAILDRVRDKPAQYVVNNLLLRTMQRARYTVENLGHFGLAARYYLHFTSPIRRYPDLIAHRVLHNLLTRSADTPVLARGIDLAEAGVHLSGRERVAVDAERDVQARLGCLFLMDRLGEEFDGIISGVSAHGLFIALMDHFISGMVPVADMDDDYYSFDSRAHRLIGERHNTIRQLGQLVRVRVVHVDLRRKQITFSLVDEQP